MISDLFYKALKEFEYGGLSEKDFFRSAASGRVLEKVEFEYEGTWKNRVEKGDKIYNLCMTGC